MCGFEHSTLLYPAKNKKTTSDVGDFACSSFDHGKYSNIYYCPNCKNGFLENIGTDKFEEQKLEGQKLYAEVEDHEYLKNIKARYLTNNQLVKTFSSELKDKDILELGAYYGAFLNEALPSVKSYTGIEPSKHAVSYLKEKYQKASILNGTIEEIIERNELEGKSFDTIVLWDVIEHVSDPIATLKTLNSFLRPGGTIIFSTINIESTFSLCMGPFWPWFMDMHYYYFSDRGYIDMLHRSGFIMKNHLHFSYFVHCYYFINKVLSILRGKPVAIPQKAEEMFKFPIKIKLGDTVTIIGKKVNNA